MTLKFNPFTASFDFDGGSTTLNITNNPGGTNGQLQVNVSGSFGGLTVGGDATLNTGTGALTIADAAVTLAKMADLAANSILGNNTGSPATPIALTGAEATALLSDFVGDSGSGGTKGLVPAPAAGDAAAGKFLKADGTFAVPAGGGGGVSISGIPTAGQIALWTDASTIQGITALPITTTAKTANFTVQSTDQGSLLAVTSAGAVAASLPQATGAFTTGWSITVANYGAGATTITPTTSTINGAATLVLNQGDYAFIVSDGTNYTATVSRASSGGGLTIDSTAITSGAAGRILFESATNKVSENSGLSFNATNKALTVGGATVTTSNPVLNLSQTWNGAGVAFTGLKFDITRTASASSLSKWAEITIDGTTNFAVGDIAAGGWSGLWLGPQTISAGSATLITLISSGTVQLNAPSGGAVGIGTNTNNYMGVDASRVSVASNLALGFAPSGSVPAATDTAFYRNAAGIMSLRGSSTTTPGAFNFYTYGASPPSAPSASMALLYADTSGGKIRLMALFPSGAAQQIAIEP